MICRFFMPETRQQSSCKTSRQSRQLGPSLNLGFKPQHVLPQFRNTRVKERPLSTCSSLGSDPPTADPGDPLDPAGWRWRSTPCWLPPGRSRISHSLGVAKLKAGPPKSGRVAGFPSNQHSSIEALRIPVSLCFPLGVDRTTVLQTLQSPGQPHCLIGRTGTAN